MVRRARSESVEETLRRPLDHTHLCSLPLFTRDSHVVRPSLRHKLEARRSRREKNRRRTNLAPFAEKRTKMDLETAMPR